MMLFFSGLVYKANTHFITANWINNAAIIVWVCWYGCQSVVCMRVIKKNVFVYMCVLVIFEREKLLQITNPTTVHQRSFAGI